MRESLFFPIKKEVYIYLVIKIHVQFGQLALNPGQLLLATNLENWISSLG